MAVELRFGLLGPVSVCVDGQECAPTRAKVRDLLGLLLTRPGRPVPSATLVDELYGATPPPTAVTALQVHVSQLRKILSPGVPIRSPQQRLQTRSGGYLLVVGDGELDVTRFVGLARRGAAELAAARPAAAVLRAALAEWRTPWAAEGSAVPALTEDFRDWAQVQRLVALEHRIEAELAEDPAADLLAELHTLVATHELHEGFVAQLALVLYRGGRQAEALAQLGTLDGRLAAAGCGRSGPAVARLRARILAADPQLTAPGRAADRPVVRARGPAALPSIAHRDGPPAAVAVPPAQLPALRGRLHGRTAVLRAVTERLTGPHPAAVLVAGPPGAGTTSVALSAAHAARRRYGDGQLYARVGPTADLRALVNGFLAELGAAPPADASTADAAAHLRGVLTGRRVLLVLDDIGGKDVAVLTAALVGTHPPDPPTTLCPARPVSGALLVGVQGDLPTGRPAHVPLGALPPSAAAAILADGIGAARAEAEPGAVGDLLAGCAHLPLAVRVAAARLATRPHWPIRLLADRLVRPGASLAELAVGDLSMRASMLRRYRGCSRVARRGLRGLGAWGPLPHPVAVDTLAAILDAGPAAAAAAAAELVAAGLLDAGPGGQGTALSLPSFPAQLAAALFGDDDRAARGRAAAELARERRRTTHLAVVGAAAGTGAPAPPSTQGLRFRPTA